MRNLSIFVCLAASLQAAQSPAFEAASIRPSSPIGGVSSMHLTPGRISMENVSLKKMLLNAYAIPDDREYMIAGPDWLGSLHFDVVATFDSGAGETQVRAMLQQMLTDRFRLAAHKESRQMPLYSLAVAKGGSKIHAVEDGQGKTSGGPGHFVASKTTIQHFADLLAKQLGAPVTNATGLEGVYDFTLDWSAADNGDGPSIFTALQEQLGLKLESTKGPLEVVIVDHMEKTPTEN